MFRFPEEVEATAISYLKRFYLKNTVMDWHPKNVMYADASPISGGNWFERQVDSIVSCHQNHEQPNFFGNIHYAHTKNSPFGCTRPRISGGSKLEF